jgi:signal transduction histidine kinase
VSDHSDELLDRLLTQRVQRLMSLAARHPLAVDLSIAIGLVGLGVLGLVGQERLQPLPLIFCVAVCAPLLLRRRSPFLCFAVIAGVAFVQWLLAGPLLADAAVLVALYWVALEGTLAEVLLAAVTVEIGAIMAAARWSTVQPLKAWVGLTGLTVAAGVLGITVRQRRAMLISLHERAAALELERDQEGRLGAAAERARIAREMHDIVAHNLSVIIALADGATYAMDSSPERALEATRRVSATGRQALLEMRRLLGVLREEEPSAQPLEPQPSLARLDDLLAQVKAAGIPVTLELDGDPRGLPDGVQLTVFRVAQEALTNTLKHAVRPAEAHMALRCRPGRLDLEVTDTGDTCGTARAGEMAGAGETAGALGEIDRERVAADTGGRGLRGMRERAAAYGGELDAGPAPQGGWRVHLSLQSDVEVAAP